MKNFSLKIFFFLCIFGIYTTLFAETTALSEYLASGSAAAANAKSNASAAKEGFLTLIFGCVYVLFLTMPFYLGIGKSMSVYGRNGGDGRYSSSSVLKFLAIPFMAHLGAVVLAVMFANIWDRFYTEFPSIRLIKAFFETTASNDAKNAWVNAANATIELGALVCYYLIISAPLVVFVCVLIVSNVMVVGLRDDSGAGKGMDHLKNNVINIVLMILFSGILTAFYQMTLDKAMFQGQSITFKTYGEASSPNQMSVNFFKKIVKFGATGQVVQ